jgi:hypothetical protein
VIRVDRGKVKVPAVLVGAEAMKAHKRARDHFAQDAAVARQQLFKFAEERVARVMKNGYYGATAQHLGLDER